MGMNLDMGIDSPLVAGARPGTIYLRSTGEWVDARSWNRAVIYDSELLITPFAAGNRQRLFANIAFPTGVPKDLRFTNMTTPSQLPSGWNAEVRGISVRVLQMETAVPGLFTTPEDVQRVLSEGVITFTTGNQKVELELPALMCPSPFGMTGVIERTGAALSSFSSINNGVAAMTAVQELPFPVALTNELTFQGTYQAPGGLILDNDTYLMMELWGVLSVPVR